MNNKIIVKVGKKSSIRFSHGKVYRAINNEELKALISKHSDCNIVIVESIYEHEQSEIKEILSTFVSKNENNLVLFYVPDNDDITCGIADELADKIEHDIILTLKDLYKQLNKLKGLNVSIYSDDKRELSEQTDSGLDGITDAFASLSFTEDDLAEPVEEVKEQVVIEPVEEVKEQEAQEDTIASFEPNIKSEDTKHITLEKEPETKEPETTVIEKAVVQEKVVHVEVPANITEADILRSDIVVKLKDELSEIKNKYNSAVKDIHEASSRIDELSEVIAVLEEEKQSMLNRFNKIISTAVVMEEPIPLVEYEDLKKKIEEHEETIKELNQKLESHKKIIEEKETEIAEHESTIEELKDKISSLNAKLDELNEKIESGEIHKALVEEHEKTIEQLNKTIEQLNSEFDRVQSELDGKTEDLNITSAKLDREASLRIETQDIIQTTVSKLVNISEELEVAQKINSELKKTNDSLNAKIADNTSKLNEQDKEIRRLKEQTDTTDMRIELATRQVEAEKSEMITQLNELKAKLQLVTDQLNQKETQYNTLVATSGIDESGASALLTTNKTLEKNNKTLNEKLAVTNTELVELKKKAGTFDSTIKSYQSQIAQLNAMIKSLSSSGGSALAASANGLANLMKPITYRCQTRIIPVFGSGSFGVTTTAMSLAYMLYAKARVLYIDFDMVTPKADSWFSIMPLCDKFPGANRNDRRMTALGIFYESGVQQFITNYDYIVKHCDNTKGGGLDYLSGLYYRPDTMKMATADYTTLFNFLGQQYHYIIIDFGKLGCSEVGDQLIKNVSDIAYRNIVVTTPDKHEVRDFNVKLNENNIRNIAWLFNLCINSSLEEQTRKTVGNIKYGMTFKDPNLQCIREKFIRNRLNKDKFEAFINSVI